MQYFDSSQPWPFAHHFGDMSLIRQTVVDLYKRQESLAAKVAITEHHPAAQNLFALQAQLTDAEWRLVNNLA